MNWQKIKSQLLTTRVGFIILITILFSLKYIVVAYLDFNLGISDPWQHIIMWTSPIGFSILLSSLGLFIKRPKISYGVMLLCDLLNTALLFANVIYYRQFTDFLTIKTMLNVGKVSQGLGKSAMSLLDTSDIIFILDFIIILLLFLAHKIKLQEKKSNSLASLMCMIGLFSITLNLFLAETSRPRLLRNTFDRSYVVKYTGINTFTIYDAIKGFNTSEANNTANMSELNKIINFTDKNYVPYSKKYFGKEANKNVIIIHLESFQQFLINLKINGKEVTPFLNSLYRGKHTISFDNFYHQVGLGRTSDAENMLETSTFGIPDGSLFTSLGSNNTFEGTPQILRQFGYTSAVFHGNTGTFWNRNDVYKNLGYNYFFDKKYWSNNADDNLGYGIKDKLLFAESIKYLEHMQQPFFAKYITVTNHIPFDLDQENRDPNFKTTDTDDKTINNYFLTAHYLDQALREFFNYLNRSGLIKNTMVVIYGDHYGLSNSEYQTLAPVIGKDASTWSEFDTATMQKVPFMIYGQNLTGEIKHNIGGEIDVLPTILHLLGVKTKDYIQFGADLLADKPRDWVVFRNGTVISKNYTIIGDKGLKSDIYQTATGKAITYLTKKQKAELTSINNQAQKSLKYSDILNTKNLLRYYVPKGFVPVDPTQFDYQNNYWEMIQLESRYSSSLYAKNHGTTTKLYQTDAPELKNRQSEITTVDSDLKNKQ
ncbi:MAG: LTA synthase family protein [Lactobacillus sp.]|nr:LTA synthase family protein [Lactobacillus sp.]